MIPVKELVNDNLWTYYVHRVGVDAFITLSSRTTGNRVFLYWFKNYDPMKDITDHSDYRILSNTEHVRIENVPYLYFKGI